MSPATTGQRWSPPIEDVLDPVFGRLGAPPMIVVMPDGTSRYGCGQWVDSPVTGNFDQYVVDDVVGFADANYRTIADPKARGVFGFSSGGFGAWNVVSRHPDVFAAMAMLSGDSFLDMTHKFMPYRFLNCIWPKRRTGQSPGTGLSEIVYDYAACYSPNPDNPPHYVGLPVDYRSGELISSATSDAPDSDQLGSIVAVITQSNLPFPRRHRPAFAIRSRTPRSAAAATRFRRWPCPRRHRSVDHPGV